MVDVDGWLCATGNAPEQYLCDKEWHRWQPGAGCSGYQIAGHNRSRWTPTPILFLRIAAYFVDKQQRGLGRKELRRGQSTTKKRNNLWRMSKIKRGQQRKIVENHAEQMAFHLPTLWLSSRRNSTSSTLKWFLNFRVTLQRWWLMKNYLTPHIQDTNSLVAMATDCSTF